jgi:ATP-binding cassette, subfamily B, bacterial
MTRSSRVLRPYLLRRWRALAAAGGSMLVVTAAELARPLPLALVVDRLLDKPAPFELTAADTRLLVIVAGLVLLIAIADAFGNYVAETTLRRAGEHIIHDLRLATHSHLQRLTLRFHERRHTGDLITRVTGDVNAVGELFSQSLGTIVQAILLLAGMVVVSVLIDPILALAAFGATPLLALVTFRFRRRLRRAARLQRAKEGEIAAMTAESFAATRVVKAFGSEAFEHRRLRRRSEERLEAGLETYRIENRFTVAIDLLSSIGLVLVLVVGVLRAAAGAISPGDVVIMSSYAKRVYRPLRDLARQTGRVSRSMARADRIAEILAADEVLEERQGAHRGGPARGALELRDVSFSHDPDRPVLTGLTLAVEAGERVAIVGPSGAGKTTTAALVARFHDPDSGQVLIDGRDLRDCSLAWLREQVALVLQDTVLFTGTVAENIAYGQEASREAVVAAAKTAGAHAFISDLPEGYDTDLGPRGVALSGGQRQRIAIARTVLRDPAILILDEPTTGLDARSEAQVLEGLRALMRGRTTLIITHSPLLAARAERAVRIDGGRIVADGPPGEVIGQPERLGVAELRGAVGAPVPPDPALPRMAELLDTGAMAGALGRSLGAKSDPPEVRVRYLRYKPGTNLVVQYDAEIDGAWHGAVAMIASKPYLRRRVRKPGNVALARAVNGRSPAPDPLYFDEPVEAMIQWLPLDLSLPALAEPAERLLERAGVDPEPGPGMEESLLAYKPRRRAVVRLGSRVLKLYAKDDEFLPAADGLARSAALPFLETADLVAVDPGLRMTVQAFLPGRRPHHPSEVAGAAGVAIGQLHARGGGGLAPAPPLSQLEAARASRDLVAAIAPSLTGRVGALVAQLEESLPADAERVPSHGDFNARQLLLDGDRLAVVDFDAMCSAPRALDVATYASYLVLGRDGDLDQALTVIALLLEGYGTRPPALSWYLSAAILRRSPRPFRYLDEAWPERVEQMVGAAEEALSA